MEDTLKESKIVDDNEIERFIVTRYLRHYWHFSTSLLKRIFSTPD